MVQKPSIRYHFQDRRGAASLLYTEKPLQVIVLECKQKPYAFDNLLHAFLAYIPSLHTTCVASVSGSKAGARVNAVYPPRGTCAEESNGIRFPKLVNQTLPQKDNTLADFTVLNEPSQSYY